MKLTIHQKDILRNIAELIEDEKYPAYRVIADYAILLLPVELNKEATNYIEDVYKEIKTNKTGVTAERRL